MVLRRLVRRYLVTSTQMRWPPLMKNAAASQAAEIGPDTRPTDAPTPRGGREKFCNHQLFYAAQNRPTRDEPRVAHGIHILQVGVNIILRL